MKLGIGIDLGGTNIKAMAFDLELGTEVARTTGPTRDGESIDGEPAFAVGVRQVLDELHEKAAETASVVGLSAPGLSDKAHTCIRFLPNRLDGLENLDWAAFLGLPRVAVLNDAHSALMGEIWQGAARGVDEVFLLTLGTGVGGAIVSGGRLMTGNIGRAGHLGHISLDPDGEPTICGTPGGLEVLVGDCTVGKRTNGRFDSTRVLVEAMLAGDAEAKTYWDETLKHLAVGIAGLINVLDPEMIILGGGISKAGDALFGPLEEKLAKIEWRPNHHKVKIKPAELGEGAGCYGAVHFGRMKAEG
ncbi:MAG: ROK family protein [Verrucomicrobiota bacterium]